MTDDIDLEAESNDSEHLIRKLQFLANRAESGADLALNILAKVSQEAADRLRELEAERDELQERLVELKPDLHNDVEAFIERLRERANAEELREKANSIEGKPGTCTLLSAAADRLESMQGELDYLKGRVTELAAEKARLEDRVEADRNRDVLEDVQVHVERTPVADLIDTVPAEELEVGDVVRFPDGREVEILDSMEGSSPTSWFLRSRDYENRADYAGEFPCRFPFERVEAASRSSKQNESSDEAASNSPKSKAVAPKTSSEGAESRADLADELERIATHLELATTATNHRAAEALKEKGGEDEAVCSVQDDERWVAISDSVIDEIERRLDERGRLRESDSEGDTGV